MNRRQWSLGLAVSAAWGALPSVVRAQGGPVEGRDFATLAKPVPTAEAKKVEVLEFFGYWCPHCAAFEPELAAWAAKMKDSPNVALRRVPVSFRPGQEAFAKLYFALESLGLVEQVHPKVFAALHGQKVAMRNEGDILAWLPSVGVDAAKVGEAMKSFSVATKLAQAQQLANAYQLDSVPTLYVAGRWRTSPAMAGARTLAVVDALIARARGA